jgi:plasmid stabilization system protein ParE
VTVYFSPEAEADFAAVVGYLVERNPVAASEFADRIFSVIDRLAEKQFEGPKQTLTSGDVVRSWPVPPVRIYYERRTDAFWVLRIYHQAQTPLVR